MMWVQPLDQEDPQRRDWLTTPVFLPVESHVQKNLVGCSPQGHKELDMTEQKHDNLGGGFLPLG